MEDNLIDRIREFIDWLEANTDFSTWDQSVKDEVHRRMITFLTPKPIKREHEWQWYVNGTFCARCGAQIGSGMECRK